MKNTEHQTHSTRDTTLHVALFIPASMLTTAGFVIVYLLSALTIPDFEYYANTIYSKITIPTVFSFSIIWGGLKLPTYLLKNSDTKIVTTIVVTALIIWNVFFFSRDLVDPSIVLSNHLMRILQTLSGLLGAIAYYFDWNFD